MSRLALAVGACAVACLAVSACGSRTAVPQPFPTARLPPPQARPPGDDTEVAALAIPTAAPLLATALSMLGAPYRNGGADPAGFDCSGFVTYVFGQHGVALPRTVQALATVGADVDSPSGGDLVFFRTSGRGPSHVGIALGPDRFIHAPSSRGVVRIEMLGSPYWAERYLESRRIVGR
jgi:cell wall-associated NlpC family hydrolase